SLYLKVLLVSIGLAGLSTLLCLLIGYPLAYIITKFKEKTRNNLILIFIIPMWMNFLLRTYAWLSLLGRNGFINKAFALIGLGPFDIMFNMKAVMIGMVYNFLPFMVLPIYTILLKIDKRLIESAKDLGCNDMKVFLKVIFPLSLPGIYTGITMVFIPAISTFVIPNLLGGNNFYLIGNLIEKQFTFTGDWGFGSAVSFILIIIMFIVMVIPGLFKGKRKSPLREEEFEYEYEEID
ncbi:ABC transporter permease, partial [uncultured Peptoniphilus sp.]|uniref:ABC transporter permease n=1 Tax=uncultured Peptoniphilus sp. TaxID=254354 RepID=UPI002805FC48